MIDCRDPSRKLLSKRDEHKRVGREYLIDGIVGFKLEEVRLDEPSIRQYKTHKNETGVYGSHNHTVKYFTPFAFIWFMVVVIVAPFIILSNAHAIDNNGYVAIIMMLVLACVPVILKGIKSGMFHALDYFAVKKIVNQPRELLKTNAKLQNEIMYQLIQQGVTEEEACNQAYDEIAKQGYHPIRMTNNYALNADNLHRFESITVLMRRYIWDKITKQPDSKLKDGWVYDNATWPTSCQELWKSIKICSLLGFVEHVMDPYDLYQLK